jgi:hypothetical protein
MDTLINNSLRVSSLEDWVKVETVEEVLGVFNKLSNLDCTRESLSNN